MRFVLFDIDGTLIDSGGAGTAALDLAFEEVCAVPNAFGTISMAGKTDLQIVKEAIALHGLSNGTGVVQDVISSYVRHLGPRLSLGKGHLKTGVKELLESLALHDRAVLGLLTGNIGTGAWMKLDFFGISSYFKAGAYGDDNEDRDNLLPLALTRLREKTGLDATYRDCVVIGDTPRDVACARPYGAFSLAVATGPYSTEELRTAGADAVFQDLSETERVLSVVMNSDIEP
jgi:phosphoglycolate phosphatase